MNSFGLRKIERRRKENEEMRNRHMQNESYDYGMAEALAPIMALTAFGQQARRRKAKREQESTMSSDDNVKEVTDEDSSES